MMTKKQPIRILKKKLTQKHILYKVFWSNGCSSYEPLSDMNQELMKLVQIYEINQVSKGDDSLKQQLLRQFEEEQYMKKQQQQLVMEPEIQKKVKVNEQMSESDDEEEVEDEVVIQSRKKQPNKTTELTAESDPCQIKHLRKVTNKNNSNYTLEFLGYFPNEQKEAWLDTKQILSKSPIALCDYLLGKIKWIQNKKKL